MKSLKEFLNFIFEKVVCLNKQRSIEKFIYQYIGCHLCRKARDSIQRVFIVKNVQRHYYELGNVKKKKNYKKTKNYFTSISRIYIINRIYYAKRVCKIIEKGNFKLSDYSVNCVTFRNYTKQFFFASLPINT